MFSFATRYRQKLTIILKQPNKVIKEFYTKTFIINFIQLQFTYIQLQRIIISALCKRASHEITSFENRPCERNFNRIDLGAALNCTSKNFDFNLHFAFPFTLPSTHLPVHLILHRYFRLRRCTHNVPNALHPVTQFSVSLRALNFKMGQIRGRKMGEIAYQKKKKKKRNSRCARRPANRRKRARDGMYRH